MSNLIRPNSSLDVLRSVSSFIRTNHKRAVAFAMVFSVLLLTGPASALAAASNGDGTMIVSPTSVVRGSSGNTFVFTFSNPNTGSSGSFSSGSSVRLIIPAGWTAPTLTAGAAGHITVTPVTCSAGTNPTISGTGPWNIDISQTCVHNGGSFTVTYGDGTSVTKVTAPSVGSFAFTTQSKNGSGGTLTNIASSPSVTVNKANTTVSITNAADLATASIANSSYAVNWNVTVTAPGSGTPTGNVTVSDGSATCSAAVVAGTCNLTSTTAGSKTITASYAGDSNFNSSVSAGVSHTVFLNLIANPSFENGVGNSPNNWTFDSFGTGNFTANYPVTGTGGAGTKAANIVATGVAATGAGADWAFDNVAVTPGQLYHFSDQYISTVPTEVDVQFTVANANAIPGECDVANSAGAGYTYCSEVLDSSVPASANFSTFSTVFTPPPGTSALTILHLLHSNGSLTVDDYSLTTGTDSNAFSQGMVSLNFDDGWQSFYDNGLPVLLADGLKSTEYIITGASGSDVNHATANTGYMNIAEIKTLQSDGNDIGAHTRSHPDLTAPGIDLNSEINGSRTDLLNNGITPVNNFAYPEGTYNSAIEAAVQNAGFTGARGVDHGLNDKATNIDEIKSYEIYSTTPVSYIESLIDSAIASKTWIVFFSHKVETGASACSTDTECISQATLQTIADYLKAKPAGTVVTTAQGLAAVLSGKSSQTITFGALTPVTYGVAPITLTATASSGLPVTYTVISGPATVSGSTLTITGVGTVDVRASQAGNGSYTAAPIVDQNLTVNAAPLTITASSGTMVHGGTVPTISPNYAGLVNGNTAPATLPTCSTTATATSAIGSYPSSCTGAADANYTISYTAGSVTVGIAALTVTADPQTKVFGASDPALTYKVTSGSLVGTDTLSGTLSRAGGENVGAYAINQGTLTAGSNYAITYVGANLDITAKPITVTADGKSKVYGDTDPALTYVSSDPAVSFSGSLTRDAGEKVGTYAINQGTLSAGTNYTLTFTGANLTVTSRPITVTAGTDTKVYDGSQSSAVLPTITVGTLATGDTTTWTQSFDSKNVGTGKILTPAGSVTDGNSGNNYTVTFVNDSTGAITAKGLTVTVTGINKIYDATPNAEVTLADDRILGDVLSESASSSFTDKNVGNGKTVDVTGIAISGTDAPNYSLTNTTTSTTADITLKDLKVSASGVNKVYDGNTNATVTLSADALSGDDVVPSYVSAAFDTANVGTGKTVSVEGISVSGADTPNYNLTNTATTTTADITKASATVTLSDLNQIYDGSAKSVTVVTDPVGLTVDVTYNGSATVPSDIGSYAVVATVNDSNYEGTSSDTLVIKDDQAPVIAAHDPVTAEATSPSGATVTYDSPAVTDNHDAPSTATCAPASGSTFALGDTTITCNATDSSGNAATATTFVVTVKDTISPELSVTTPASPTNNTPSISFTATDATTLTTECKVDDGAYETCPNPFTPTIGTDGSHTVTVKATDQGGNSVEKTTDSFTTDATAPVVSITTGPANNSFISTDSTTIQFTVDDESAALTCTFDGSDYTPCTASTDLVFSGLEQRGYNFTVTATDAVGNHTSDSRSFTVDSIKPVVHLGTVATPTSNTTPEIDFTVEDATAVTTTCSVDGGDPVSCSAPSFITPTLADGAHSVVIQSTDSAGNVSDAVTASFTIDTQAPAVHITSKPASFINVDSANFEFTVDDGTATVECNLSPDSPDFTACTSPQSLTALSEGSHTFAVRATDELGHVGEDAADFTVDKTAPIIASHENVIAEATSADGAVVNYDLPEVTDNLDPGISVSCSLSSGSTFPIGDTTVNCNSTDAAGNAATETSFTVTVHDTTAPVIASHEGVTAEATSPSGATVTYDNPTASDAVDGSVAVTCDPVSGSDFVIGDTPVTCNSTDAHGNAATPTTFTVHVADTSAPVITLNGDSTVNLILDSDPYVDPGAAATDIVDGNLTSHIAVTGDTVDTSVAGTYHINYDVSDSAGNVATEVVRTVIVSALTLEAEQSANPSTNSVTINWTTSHPATSRVVWGTTSITTASSTEAGAPNYGYDNSTVEDSATTTSHSVIVSGLSPGTTYYFRPVSHGSPETIGDEIAVTTGTPAPVVTTTTSGGGGGGGGPLYGYGAVNSKPGDINKDGKVDMLDFVVLMANWNQSGARNSADLNNDGKVDILDFVTLMANWGK